MNPFVTLLIGHRGVGKTTLLEMYARANSDVRCLDLDRAVEARSGRTVADLLREGESVFRRWETETLQHLVHGSAAVGRTVIAVGAGYTGEYPATARALWVRRESDHLGRIFLDRPRLDPAVSARDEYLARFAEREARYAACADDVLTLREGAIEPAALDWLNTFARNTPPTPALVDASASAVLTVLPEHLRGDWRAWAQRWLARGLACFELRDDLLSADQMRAVENSLPAERLLRSYRLGTSAAASKLRSDWALELGAPLLRAAGIVSKHVRPAGQSLEDFLQELERAGSTEHWLKAAPVVQSWSELLAGHRWQRRDPARRIFLPRSLDESGRWTWYRLRQKGHQPLNFVREARGSAADQPTWLPWCAASAGARDFRAILGDPVEHSWTPVEQGALAIRLSLAEAESGALEILREMGLRTASVTSPLKGWAFGVAELCSESAQGFESINTLQWDDARSAWRGTNTDYAGFLSAIEGWDATAPVAVWGGGGVLPVIRRALPAAACYSARTGDLRAGAPVSSPRYLVWAAGNEASFPPTDWKPAVVLDLSYADHSVARSYALACGARYVSGEVMFRRQAAEQRRFWSTYGG
ncbi:MAG: hypothetical protein JST16_04355 [Bdellovibrionales bacterium]|nr:hypothetical protein [Bdellovibrionales bacterium]